jgi:hypothetical protein
VVTWIKLKPLRTIIECTLLSPYRKKQGQRVYLNDAQARDMMNQLNAFFETDSGHDQGGLKRGRIVIDLLFMSHKAKPDELRARLAQLFIEKGFNYLSEMGGTYTTTNQRRIMDDAVELSNQLSYLVTQRTKEAERK